MKVSNRGWNIRDIAERRREARRVRELLAVLEPSGPCTRIVCVRIRVQPSLRLRLQRLSRRVKAIDGYMAAHVAMAGVGP
jgi:hypothetical protein